MSCYILSSLGGRELLTSELAKKYVSPLQQAIDEKQLDKYDRVVISGKSFGRDAATIFGSVFSQLKGLTTVDMSDCIAQRLTDEVRDVLTSLSVGLAKHSLTELNVSDNALGLAGIQALKEVLKSQRSLHRLFCNNDGLQADAVNLITQLLLDPTESGKHGISTLKTFEIFNNMLGAAGGRALAPLLAASPHLEHVRISTNRIGEPSAGLAIANALKNHTSFISLTLCDNTFGVQAAKSLASGVLSHAPHLLHLNLSDLGLVDEDNDDYSGLIAIIKALRKTAPLLQILDLQSSCINPRVARHLAKTLEHKHELRVINLEGNEIKSSGAMAIVESLRHHPHLKEINLMQNSISSRVTPVITSILCTKPSLTSLQLNRNAFSKESIAEIEKALEQAENENEQVLGSWSDNEQDEDEEEDEEQEEEDEEDEDEHADKDVDKLAGELEQKSKVSS